MMFKKLTAFVLAAVIAASSLGAFAQELPIETGSAPESAASSAEQAVSSSEVESSTGIESEASSDESASSETAASSDESSSSEIAASSDETPASESASSIDITVGEAIDTAIVPSATDGATEFVTRFYNVILKRDPSAYDLSCWVPYLKSQQITGADVLLGFFESAEYIAQDKDDTDYITDLYAAVLGRAPDDAGLADWLKALICSVSRKYCVKGFADSPEFKKMCNEYGILSGTVTLTENRDMNIDVTAYVARLYRTALGREPDVKGLNDWTGGLNSHVINGAQALDGFFSSEEYTKNGTSDTVFLQNLYSAAFNREPDASGMAGWQTALDAMMSRRYCIKGFCDSAEFIKMCNSYGVVAGTIALTENRDVNIKSSSFVVSVYKAALARKPDIASLNSYTRSLNSKYVSCVQIIKEIFNSSEYASRGRTDSEFITDLYTAMFGKAPDAGTLGYWNNVISLSGCSHNYIIKNFAESTEFISACTAGGMTPGSVTLTESRDLYVSQILFVQRLYSNFLGRLDGQAEALSYAQRLASGSIDGASIVKTIIGSAEFTNRNLDNAAFVRAAYLAMLNRSANDVEVATQVSYLASHSRLDFIGRIIDSTEYKTVCAAAGVLPGSSKSVWNIIDVSKYQGTIDWTAVAASGRVDGVIIRAVSTSNADGLYVDPYFAANVIGAKRAGLDVGVYYVLYGSNTAECDREVNLMLSEIAKLEAQGYYIDLPVACDLEYNSSKLNQTDLSMLGRYSMNLIENAGYYPILYTGLDFLHNSLYANEMGGRDVWVAWYPYLTYNGKVYGGSEVAPAGATPCDKYGNATNPSKYSKYPFSGYTMWQYRSDDTISGISTVEHIDMSYSYKDYASIISTTLRSDGTKWNHLK